MNCKTGILIAIIYCLICTTAYAQKTDTSPKKIDTVKPSFLAKIQAFAKMEARKGIEEFNADKRAIDQRRILEEIKKTAQKAKIYLKSGIDTTGTQAELKSIRKDLNIAGDGVFSNKGSAQTFRNLTSTSLILKELLNKAIARKAKLDAYQQQLSNLHFQVDSLSSNPILLNFPQDSVGARKYLQQMIVVAYETAPVDSVLKQAMSNVQTLLNSVNLEVFKLQSELEEIELYQNNISDKTYNREFVNIWESEGYFRPFNQVLKHSGQKALINLRFYTTHNKGLILLMCLLIICSFVYLRSLKNIYREGNMLADDFNGQLVLRYPLLSAVLILINIFQFFFYSPPFILNVMIWLISGLCLSIIFKNFISRYWMNIWLTMFGLFIISSLDNLVLQATRTERWMMLATASVGVLITAYSLLRGNRSLLREKWMVYPIGIAGIVELFSIVANVFGRYNMAKSLLIAGFMNVVIAIVFLWTIRLINEGLSLAYTVYTRPDKKLFYINFQRVGQRAPTLFYILMICGWVVLLGRNFPAYESFAKPFREFFTSDRTIGDYTFSIVNLLMFIAIMGISVIISKVVSFFASDHHAASDKEEQKGLQAVGSWLLLIRISILSIGLFLALAASGIPIDRITIVLGALGVGIGFGLQTLVNNLVSGLIIAFEKPVNVGDVVDIGGTTGTMKSVGFRSSVIATWEGADVVMPNGDLLSAHLTNWSLGGSKKRTSVMVDIAYDSDLQNVKQIITDLLDSDERIAKNPRYAVQYEQFNTSAITLRIYFWAKHMKESANIKSDLIIAITDLFRKNNIVIPFPQQNVYIQNPESLKKGK